jgi:hypothetical protein
MSVALLGWVCTNYSRARGFHETINGLTASAPEAPP